MKELIFLVIAIAASGFFAQSMGYDFYRVADTAEPELNESETVLMSQCSSLEDNLKNKGCENPINLIVQPKRLSLVVLVGFVFGGWLASWYRRKWRGEVT